MTHQWWPASHFATTVATVAPTTKHETWLTHVVPIHRFYCCSCSLDAIHFKKNTKQSTGKTQNSEVWVLTATDSKRLSNVVEAWGWITGQLSAILPTICVKSKLLMAAICVNIETAGNSSRPRRSPRQTLRFHLGNQNLGNHGWINHSNLHMFK